MSEHFDSTKNKNNETFHVVFSSFSKNSTSTSVANNSNCIVNSTNTDR